MSVKIRRRDHGHVPGDRRRRDRLPDRRRGAGGGGGRAPRATLRRRLAVHTASAARRARPARGGCARSPTRADAGLRGGRRRRRRTWRCTTSGCTGCATSRRRSACSRSGDATPPRSLDATPNNLPSRPTTFVGREAELAELHAARGRHAAADHRRAGRERQDAPGGRSSRRSRPAAGPTACGGSSWARSPTRGRSASAVADGARRARRPGAGRRPHSLRAQLARRRLLLCLDNCEHVLDAAAEVAGAACRAARRWRSSPRAASRSGSRARRCGGCRRCPPEEARALFLERAAQRAARPRARRGDARSSRCARGWTARRWRSSSPPRGRGRSRRARSRRASTTASRCSCAARATPCRGTRACSPRWRGATSCSTRPTAPCSGAWRCSPAASTSTPRARCAAEDGRRSARSRGSSTSRSWSADGERYRLPETIRAVRRRPAARGGRARARRPTATSTTGSPACASWRRSSSATRTAGGAALAREHDNLRAAIEHGLEADDPTRGARAGRRAAVAVAPAAPGARGAGRAAARDRARAGRALGAAGAAADRDRAGRRHGRPAGPRVDAAQPARRARAPSTATSALLALCLALAAVGRFYTDIDGARETALEAERLAARAARVRRRRRRARCGGSSPTCATSTPGARRCSSEAAEALVGARRARRRLDRAGVLVRQRAG